MVNLRAVFFDLDGTLLDTAPDLANALNRLLADEGRDTLPFESIRRVASDGAYAMLKLGFGVERDDPPTASLRQRLLDFYLDDLSSGTSVFKGVDTLIEKLDNQALAWGVVTNKPLTYAEPLMERFSFARSPICLICPEHVSERKPHPEALELACQIAECKPDEAIYVGDHERDIQCGQRAGMPTIAASYGYISEGQSAHDWGADHVVDHGQEIWPIIHSYINERRPATDN